MVSLSLKSLYGVIKPWCRRVVLQLFDRRNLIKVRWAAASLSPYCDACANTDEDLNIAMLLADLAEEERGRTGHLLNEMFFTSSSYFLFLQLQPGPYRGVCIRRSPPDCTVVIPRAPSHPAVKLRKNLLIGQLLTLWWRWAGEGKGDGGEGIEGTVRESNPLWGGGGC